MKTTLMFVCVTSAALLAGCAGRGPDGETSFSVGTSACERIHQISQDWSAAVNVKKDLVQVTGNAKPEPLIAFEQNCAVLYAQMQQACDFFNRRQLTAEQYLSEMNQIRKLMGQQCPAAPPPASVATGTTSASGVKPASAADAASAPVAGCRLPVAGNQKHSKKRGAGQNKSSG